MLLPACLLRHDGLEPQTVIHNKLCLPLLPLCGILVVAIKTGTATRHVGSFGAAGKSHPKAQLCKQKKREIEDLLHLFALII